MIRIPNTLQEIFNIVSAHLLNQGQKSVSNGICMYRGPNGLKCAAGCLIPDEEYNPEFESNRWNVLVDDGLIQNKFKTEIVALQEIHDYAPKNDPEQCVIQWKTKLIEFANEYKLTHSIQ
jgi:hypothetical protein